MTQLHTTQKPKKKPIRQKLYNYKRKYIYLQEESV